MMLSLSTDRVLDLAKKADLELHPEPSSSSFVKLPAEEEIKLYFVVKEHAQELKVINTWIREQEEATGICVEETYPNQGSGTDWEVFLDAAIEGKLHRETKDRLEELYLNNSVDSVFVKMQNINNRGLSCEYKKE
jgi:hypothetical protein